MSKIVNAFIKLKNYLHQRIRRSKLRHTDFTIISNNCWAATAVYQPFGLKYNTPTVGLFIMDEDYMRFLENLKYYLSQTPVFINPQESRYYDKISDNGAKSVTYPIATIGGDVELHFLHYHSEEEALSKWQRRTQRINYDRLLIKMSLRDSGYNQEAMLSRFSSLNYKNKICFSPIPRQSSDIIFVNELQDLNLVGGDETEATLKRINIVSILNKLL